MIMLMILCMIFRITWLRGRDRGALSANGIGNKAWGCKDDTVAINGDTIGSLDIVVLLTAHETSRSMSAQTRGRSP